MGKKQKAKNAIRAIELAGQSALVAALKTDDPRHAATLFSVGLVACSTSTITAFVADRLDRLRAGWSAARQSPEEPTIVAYPQAMIEAARILLDAPSAEVAEPLGRLVAMYEGKTIDGFFRGTARLLGDLTEPELEDMRVLVQAMLRFPHKGPFLMLAHTTREDAAVLVDSGERNNTSNGAEPKRLDMKNTRRLAGLLRSTLLAEDGKGLAIGLAGDGGTWTVDTELARPVGRKLAKVLGAPSKNAGKSNGSKAKKKN